MNKLQTVRKVLTILDILDQIDSIPDFDLDFDHIDFIYKNNAECAKRPPTVAATVADEAIKEIENQAQNDDDAHTAKRQKTVAHSPVRGLKDAENPLEALTEDEFQRAFRFNKETVQDILKMLSYGLAKVTNRGQPVSPMFELLITLRFLATGSFQTKMCKNVSQPTISRILKRVTTLLSEQRLRFIKIPERSDFKRISGQFYKRGGCPEVFGCVGSTHVAIKSPGKNLAEGYLNELGYHSFRTLVSGKFSFYKFH